MSGIRVTEKTAILQILEELNFNICFCFVLCCLVVAAAVVFALEQVCEHYKLTNPFKSQ